MMCERPFFVKSQNIEVACGRCLPCRLARKAEWAMRLDAHKETYKDACFLTLTYNDNHLKYSSLLNSDKGLSTDPRPTLCKRDYQIFLKRLRHNFPGRKITYFMCGEYGSKLDRPHYHLILFGLSFEDMLPRPLGLKRNGFDQYSSMLAEYLWVDSLHYSMGFNTIGFLTEKSARYVAGYSSKKLYGDAAAKYEGVVPPFLACSKGIGLEWAFKHKESLLKNPSIRCSKGKFMPVPLAWRRRLGMDAEFYQAFLKDRDADEVKKFEEEYVPSWNRSDRFTEAFVPFVAPSHYGFFSGVPYKDRLGKYDERIYSDVLNKFYSPFFLAFRRFYRTSRGSLIFHRFQRDMLRQGVF